MACHVGPLPGWIYSQVTVIKKDEHQRGINSRVELIIAQLGRPSWQFHCVNGGQLQEFSPASDVGGMSENWMRGGVREGVKRDGEWEGLG